MDYAKLKGIVVKHNTKGKHKFINRNKGSKRLCIILMGYKQKLWPDVLERFTRFVPSDIDVCLITSGKYMKEVEEIAEKYSYSYLSTKKNNVCLAQNIAISKFENAELIFKMDEDMFLTENVFEKMEEALKTAEEKWSCNAGVIVPLINVNGYGYYRILQKIGKIEEFERLFGKAKMEAGQKTKIESDVEIAKFMWGSGGYIPKLDDLNRMMKGGDVSLCPIRFSIGFVMFRRSFWESFWRFPVIFGNGIGLDETIMISAAVSNSQILAVAEGAVVGHFGFGPQTEKMLDFYKDNRSLFALS